MIRLATILAAVALSLPAMASDFAWKAVGAVRVIDGDTLVLLSPRFYVCPGAAPCPDEYSRPESMTVRLYGIDAPELEQVCYTALGKPWDCGARSAMEMIDLIGTDEVTCFGGQGKTGVGQGGKHVAICHVWGRAHLGMQMLTSGYAVAEYYIASDEQVYRGAENAARSQGLGMWRGGFTRPAEWREQQQEMRSILRDLKEREEEIGPYRDG